MKRSPAISLKDELRFLHCRGAGNLIRYVFKGSKGLMKNCRRSHFADRKIAGLGFSPNEKVK